MVGFPPVLLCAMTAAAVAALSVRGGDGCRVSASPPAEWATTAAVARLGPAATCIDRTATDAYAGTVRRAVSSRRDVWGEKLLAASGGPTYERARQFLAPLLYARQPKHL